MTRGGGPLRQQRRGAFLDVEIQPEYRVRDDAGKSWQPVRWLRHERQIEGLGARRLGRHIMAQ